jgi:DNA-binding XRE family transcriptional regulator
MGMQPEVASLSPMDEDTKRLGSELQAAREGRRPKLTQEAVAEQLGVGRTTVQNIERGKFTKVTPTIREFARIVGWPDGAADRVFAGGPVLAVASPPEISPEAPTELRALGLSPAVEYELRSGETLESMVISLGPEESDGHLIVALQGRKGATPEEVARIVARYRKVRPRLQGIATDDEVADS